MINIPKTRWRAVTKYSMETGRAIKTYPSISMAARKNKLHRQTINNCVVGKSKSCGGYIWKYAENYEHDNQKVCCKCRVELTDKNKARKNFNICKDCHKIWKKKRLNYVNDFLNKVYNRHKALSRKKGEDLSYSFDEFLGWISDQYKFFKMFRIWVQDKQNKGLTPYITRIDTNKPYALDNLEIITKEQWCKKFERPVEQWDKKGVNLICTYSSIKEASFVTGVDKSKITAVARNRKDRNRNDPSGKKFFTNRTGGGFKWKYSNKFQEIPDK